MVSAVEVKNQIGKRWVVRFVVDNDSSWWEAEADDVKLMRADPKDLVEICKTLDNPRYIPNFSHRRY